MLRDSVVVVVIAIVCTRPRAIQLAMITMRKSAHGFPFVSHIWDAYGAPFGGPLGRRSSAIKLEVPATDKIHIEDQYGLAELSQTMGYTTHKTVN